MSIQIYNEEILAWSVQEAERIKSGESAPYHAVLCDPPYGIAFMGKEWDDALGINLDFRPNGQGASRHQACEPQAETGCESHGRTEAAIAG
jgi:hypothetical protein